MKKKVHKITIEQTNKIKALAKEGKTALEIKNQMKLPLHIVRYHVERVKIAQAEGKLPTKPSSVKLEDSSTIEQPNYKAVLDDLARATKVIEALMSAQQH